MYNFFIFSGLAAKSRLKKDGNQRRRIEQEEGPLKRELMRNNAVSASLPSLVMSSLPDPLLLVSLLVLPLDLPPLLRYRGCYDYTKTALSAPPSGTNCCNPTATPTAATGTTIGTFIGTFIGAPTATALLLVSHCLLQNSSTLACQL